MREIEVEKFTREDSIVTDEKSGKKYYLWAFTMNGSTICQHYSEKHPKDMLNMLKNL